MELYRRAFRELTSDRPVGMAPGPIPWSSIDRWAARHGITGEQFEDLVCMVRAQDDEYMQHQRDSKKSKKGKGDSSGRVQF